MDVDEDDGSDLDRMAAGFLRSAWKSSPGLVASLLFHGAILAVLPFIIFADRIRELAAIPITIGVSARRLDPERPYKPIASAPPTLDGEGGDEPPAKFPDARPAERNEAPSERTGNDRIDGDGRLALEHMTHEALASGFRGRLAGGPPGTNDVMGVGGGSGSGGALRAMGSGGALGRELLVARGGGSAATEAAVAAGLSWLARHQLPDGSFRAKTPCGKCPSDDTDMADVAATSLAAIAFMTAGYGPENRLEIPDAVTGRSLRYGDTVRAALAYLRTRQSKAGCIAGKKSGKQELIYEHAFATMALCEACRRTKDAEIRNAATRAVQHLLDRQNSGAAWQYGPRDGDSDTSVTGACVQALRAAQLAGIEVPKSNLADVEHFMARVSNKDGSTGYANAGDSTPATTAIGLYVKRFLRMQNTTFGLAAKKIAADVGNAQTETNAYLWYYAMLALFEHEGPKGASWKAVNEAVTTALVKRQHRERACSGGAWDGDGDTYFRGQGRAFMTAVAVLTLEVYYRFADVVPSEPCATAAPR